MNNNKKLIEEAAKAMWADPEQWATVADPIRKDFLDMARDALAVFEKALTPTDEEREALIKSYEGWDFVEVALSPNGASRVIADLAQRLDAALRRSVVPEPSTEHECEFGCASDVEHMQRAYDALKSEYEGYRQWVRIAFLSQHRGGRREEDRKAMQAALSEYIKLRVEAAHTAQGSKGA